MEFYDTIKDKNYYSISAPSWEIARVLDRIITWDDFSLTFQDEAEQETGCISENY